jgi:hypothetical protein
MASGAANLTYRPQRTGKTGGFGRAEIRQPFFRASYFSRLPAAGFELCLNPLEL